MYMRERERESGITWSYCPLGIAGICFASSFALFFSVFVFPSNKNFVFSFEKDDLLSMFRLHSPFFCPLLNYFSLSSEKSRGVTLDVFG